MGQLHTAGARDSLLVMTRRHGCRHDVILGMMLLVGLASRLRRFVGTGGDVLAPVLLLLQNLLVVCDVAGVGHALLLR